MIAEIDQPFRKIDDISSTQYLCDRKPSGVW